MNLKITRHSSYRRLDRIEAYARRAHQRLLHRALAEFDRYAYQRNIAPINTVSHTVRSFGCASAMTRVGKQYMGCTDIGIDAVRNLIMAGGFGLRLARIFRRAERLDYVMEEVEEEYGSRDGESAADCAEWSGAWAARLDWEASHMERYPE